MQRLLARALSLAADILRGFFDPPSNADPL